MPGNSGTFMGMVGARKGDGFRVCIGLDPDLEKIPQGVPVRDFVFQVVEATAPYAAAFKPNLAFYEALENGWALVGDLVKHIRQINPNIPIIADGKRGDIGNTNRSYFSSVFDVLGADALTVHPYLGQESLQTAMAERPEKGFLVLCRTSNPGAREFQDKICLVPDDPVLGKTEVPLYQIVARNVYRDWNANHNCGLVAGATFPDEIGEIRKIAPDMLFLIPGVGTQGGDLEAAVKNAFVAASLADFVVNVSGAVLYAFAKGQFQRDPSDFAGAASAAAEDYHNQIQAAIRSLAA